MNEREKLTELVEYKIGKVLRRDVKKNVKTGESVFDVDEYSEKLYERYFANINKNDAGNSKCRALADSAKPNSDEFYFTDGFSQDQSDDEEYYFQSSSLDNIIVNLESRSEDIQMRGLRALQCSSAEELVNQSSWAQARKLLQDSLKSSTSDRVKRQILELFRRFLLSNEIPKVVSEAFISLAECIIFHINAINAPECKESPQEIGNKQNGRLVHNPNSRKHLNVKQVSPDIGIVFKAMWLLVQSQRGIPLKWHRFNEKRLKEIIFPFIHMLSSSTMFMKSSHICSLEVLSLLDPKATWCKNWCHSAIGRSLLCMALKTYKKVFTEMVDFVLLRIKYKDQLHNHLNRSISLSVNFKLPPLKESNTTVGSVIDERKSPRDKKNAKEEKHSATSGVRLEKVNKVKRSAPPLLSEEHSASESTRLANDSDPILKNGLPRHVVSEATFCHCLSTIAYLVQSRSSRTLFPIDMAFRKRRITISDFVSTTLNHITSGNFYVDRQKFITDEYKAHMTKLIAVLKSL